METFEVRAREVLRRCPKGPLVGAEIGVSLGQMSQSLLTLHKGLTLYMVDPWAAAEDQSEEYRNSGDNHGRYSKGEQDAHYRVALEATAPFGDRAIAIRLPSLDAEVSQPLDFVFIDGDHTYKAVVADIEKWKKALKPGGLLGGHDYNYPAEEPWAKGVKQAVDEAVIKYGWKLELGENWTWFVKL